MSAPSEPPLTLPLILLPVLPREAWLTLDDVLAAADAYQVGVTSGEHAEQLLRALRRRGFIRCRVDDDGASAWQVTPSGVDAAQPLTQTPDPL